MEQAQSAHRQNPASSEGPTPIEVTRVEVDLHRKELEGQVDSFRNKSKSYSEELWKDGRGIVRKSGQLMKAWLAVAKKQAMTRLKLAA